MFVLISCRLSEKQYAYMLSSAQISSSHSIIMHISYTLHVSFFSHTYCTASIYLSIFYLSSIFFRLSTVSTVSTVSIYLSTYLSNSTVGRYVRYLPLGSCMQQASHQKSIGHPLAPCMLAKLHRAR